MAMVDLEVGLSEEEVAVRDLAHKFAVEVMRPAGIALDRLDDPQQVIAEGSVLYDVHSRYRALGLSALSESVQDPVMRARMSYLVQEELGYGDAGLAISLGAGSMHKPFIAAIGSAELAERYNAPDSTDIGCWAITEPNHGSDTLADSNEVYEPPSTKPDLLAELDGDHYVLNGQKAAWVSNGSIATVALLFLNIMKGGKLEGGAIGIVPLDVPGVTKGKALDKLGQRSLNQGEIYFDNVRVPASYVFVGPDGHPYFRELVLAIANMHMGITFCGLTRASLELAEAYTRERIQGGKRLCEHGTVRSRLFKMFAKAEAARSLSRRVFLYNSTNPPQLHYSVASKVFSTDTAFEVTTAALQLFGGNGLTREYPIEKLLRDARASQIEDGCNEYLGMVAGGKLGVPA